MTTSNPRLWGIGAAGFLVGAVFTSIVGAVAAIAAFIYAGGPVADEWQCSKGEYPIVAPEGGSQCLPYGAVMPRGWTAMPKGNQPLSVDQ